MKHTFWLLVSFFILSIVTGCGDNGNDNNTGSPNLSTSSNWDEMKWDQGQWK